MELTASDRINQGIKIMMNYELEQELTSSDGFNQGIKIMMNNEW